MSTPSHLPEPKLRITGKLWASHNHADTRRHRDDDRRRDGRALEASHNFYSSLRRRRPIPVARAKGIYFWTPEGKRFLDFNSQLMCVNIGHGDDRVFNAINDRLDPALHESVHGHRARARLGAKLAEDRTWRHQPTSSSRTEARRRTRTPSRSRTGTPAAGKFWARYRSYHGATAGAITVTGDPRRWAAEPGTPGVVSCAGARITVSSVAGTTTE